MLVGRTFGAVSFGEDKAICQSQRKEPMSTDGLSFTAL